MTLHFGNHFCYHAANTALDGIIEGLEGLNKALVKIQILSLEKYTYK